MRCQELKQADSSFSGLSIVLALLTFSFFVLSLSGNLSAQKQVEDRRSMTQAYEIIEDFVREDYLSGWAGSSRLMRRRFSDPLDYYWGKRDVPLKEVIRDKMAYIARWPQRYFRLVEDSLEVTRSQEDDYIYAVKFRYEFETQRRGSQKAGIGETSLLLELFDRRILIRGEGGKVLERY